MKIIKVPIKATRNLNNILQMAICKSSLLPPRILARSGDDVPYLPAIQLFMLQNMEMASYIGNIDILSVVECIEAIDESLPDLESLLGV